ncbi:MAG: hypothetical protein V3R77_03025, partial [Candidatus Binatia bacterium]
NPDEVVTDNPGSIKLEMAAGGTNGGAEADQFHPMKGPMTTQTLRGLSNSGPMHWRGDRADGFFGQGLDENLSFNNFIVAFAGLVGRESIISTGDMQAFTDFALTMTLPPNPVRALDNSLTSDQQAGADFYLGSRLSDGVPGFGFTCNGCHTLDASQGFFGTDGTFSFENEPQIMKITHLRNLYQKVGMFGMPNVPFLNGGDNGHQGDQIRGFGFLHDGSTDTVFRFFQATVFNDTGDVGFNGGNTQRRQMEEFMLAFDSDLAPVVGQQVTRSDTNGTTVDSRVTLLVQRAGTSFTSKVLGGVVTECDLVVKGNIVSEPRGWVLSDGVFVGDKASESALSDGALRALSNMPGQELTYTCVPPGSGVRLGIDRDEDTVLDGDDNCPAVPNPGQQDSNMNGIGDACDTGIPTTTTTSTTNTTSGTVTTTSSTTTTTIAPGAACGPAPEPDAACTLAHASGAGKSLIFIRDHGDSSKDQIKWKWNKGDTVAIAQFGSPESSTSTYDVCVYKMAGLVAAHDVPAGGVVGSCSGKPCWRATGTKGFTYKNKAGAPNGITSIKLRAGEAGKSKIQVKGKGSALGVPPTLGLSEVVVQLLIDDGTGIECFKTTFPDSGISKQDDRTFKAKGP